MTKPFVLVGGVNTVADMPAEISALHIPQNLALGYPRLHHLPEFQQDKGGLPIALIGGGPSVKDHLHEAARMPVTIACGSVHDWLRSQDFTPDYCAVCDPDPIMAKYLRFPSPRTKFLVSSHCHPSVFEALKGLSIAIWHCHPVGDALLRELEGDDYQAIGGGCTIGLRAISIAILLGYRNLHFFGFDSCLGFEDAHHAYDFATDAEETGKVYEIKMGRTDGSQVTERTYRCAGYHLAQAEHVKQFTKLHGELFRPTFHGEGLLPDFWRLIEAEINTIQQKEAA